MSSSEVSVTPSRHHIHWQVVIRWLLSLDERIADKYFYSHGKYKRRYYSIKWRSLVVADCGHLFPSLSLLLSSRSTFLSTRSDFSFMNSCQFLSSIVYLMFVLLYVYATDYGHMIYLQFNLIFRIVIYVDKYCDLLLVLRRNIRSHRLRFDQSNPFMATKRFFEN